jgi:hypothetical protein
VEVALESPALVVAGRHQPQRRFAQLLCLPALGRAQRFALECQARGSHRGREQVGRGAQVGSMLDPGDDAARAFDGRAHPSRRSHGRRSRTIGSRWLPGFGMRPEQAHAGVAEGATEDIADFVRVRRCGDSEPAERAAHEDGPHRAPRKADSHQSQSNGC